MKAIYDRDIKSVRNTLQVRHCFLGLTYSIHSIYLGILIMEPEEGKASCEIVHTYITSLPLVGCTVLVQKYGKEVHGARGPSPF